MIQTGVAAESIDVAQAVAEVAGAAHGGIAVFIGTVRESAAVEGHGGKSVTRLDYEAHPTLAAAKLEEIAAAAAAKWGVGAVVALHRTGTCELGEPTVVVACGAPHRGDALDACRYIIDTIKAEAPIWKREVYADSGGSAWVGTP
jgi:molybdopterin synthase catalytic subunit